MVKVTVYTFRPDFAEISSLRSKRRENKSFTNFTFTDDFYGKTKTATMTTTKTTVGCVIHVLSWSLFFYYRLNFVWFGFILFVWLYFFAFLWLGRGKNLVWPESYTGLDIKRNDGAQAQTIYVHEIGHKERWWSDGAQWWDGNTRIWKWQERK